MKKMLLLLLAGTMLLTSCTSGENNADSGDMGNDSAQTDDGSNTLGDDDGDGMIEDGEDGGPNSPGSMTDGSDSSGNADGSGGTDDSDGSGGSGSAGGSGNTDSSGGSGGSSGSGSSGGSGNTGGSLNAGGDGSVFDTVEKVESADDAVNFIGANVYSQCADVIPMMTETRTLSREDMDSITYNTGLTDTTGIQDIILSESMIGSAPYSLVMLRTDGANTEELQKALGESVNPRKWVCVQAERIASVMLDDDIVLVMGEAKQVDTVMNSVTTAASGVYRDVGSVVSVMG